MGVVLILNSCVKMILVSDCYCRDELDHKLNGSTISWTKMSMQGPQRTWVAKCVGPCKVHDVYGVCERLAEGAQFNGPTSLGLLVLPIPSSGKHQSNITHTHNHAYHYDD